MDEGLDSAMSCESQQKLLAREHISKLCNKYIDVNSTASRSRYFCGLCSSGFASPKSPVIDN